MTKQIFINLAVKDLQKSMDFYAALGFTNNLQFSDDSAKCMVWSENIFVMIMTHEKFKTFATKPLADTKLKLAGLFSLSVDSVDEMNRIVNNGLEAGGIGQKEITQKKSVKKLMVNLSMNGKQNVWVVKLELVGKILKLLVR